jgi:UPF0755 protein
VIKKFLTGLIMLWVIVFGGFFLISNYYNKVAAKPFILEQDSYEVKIKTGSNLNSVLTSLDKEGKLRNYYLVKFYISRNNLAPKINPGFLTINKNMSINDFINGLQNVKAEDPDAIKVTFPEGYDIDKISELLEKKGVISKDEFLMACKEYELPDYIKKSDKRRFALEGYLFPATYEFKKGISGEGVINKMLNKFEDVLKECEVELNTEISSDKIDEIVTVAAMIEKEAINKEEMPTIASVVKNRVAKKMKLQIDATVLYALGTHKDVVTYKDLEVDSPYNTYEVPALPIGPIANPGKDSIKAAIIPSRTNYLYYVFDKKNGAHFFTDDYNKFLKKKNEQKQ